MIPRFAGIRTYMRAPHVTELLFSVVLLDRRWIARVLSFAGRFIKRVPPPEELPDQRWILYAFAFNLVSIVTTSLAYSVLVGGSLASMFPFAAAFTAGYVRS